MLDFVAIFRSYYGTFYQSISESFREEISPGLQPCRLNGFVDAVNHLEVNMDELDPLTLEKWRIDAQEACKLCRSSYETLKSLGAKTAMTHELLIALSHSLCLPLSIMAVMWLNPWLLVIPIIIIVIAKLQRFFIAKTLDEQLARLYYEHGYAEGIIVMSDKHNLHTDIKLDTPLNF